MDILRKILSVKAGVSLAFADRLEAQQQKDFMANKTENYNPEAFPVAFNLNQAVVTGMTLRDYFAAKAMQGFISTNALERGVEFNISLEDNERLLAEVSYRVADAMLKARSKQ